MHFNDTAEDLRKTLVAGIYFQWSSKTWDISWILTMYIFLATFVEEPDFAAFQVLSCLTNFWQVEIVEWSQFNFWKGSLYMSRESVHFLKGFLIIWIVSQSKNLSFRFWVHWGLFRLIEAYWGLLRLIRAYWGLLGLIEAYWGLLGLILIAYWGLLGLIRAYSECLLRLIGAYWCLFAVETVKKIFPALDV